MKLDKGHKDDSCAKPKGRSGPAFLLAQVGAHAASKFAERLGELKLAPAHAGIFRILGTSPAITQQTLATALGTLPSRLVALVDELESKGLLERRPHESDRRSYALHLTEAGQSTLQAIGRIARDHQQALLAALSEEEQRQLAALLQRVADQQDLIPVFILATHAANVPNGVEAEQGPGEQEPMTTSIFSDRSLRGRQRGLIHSIFTPEIFTPFSLT